MRSLQLLTLAVVLAGLGRSDTLTDMTHDCGQPGSNLYADCEALFGGGTGGPLPDISTLGPLPTLSGPPGRWDFTVEAASADGSHVAVRAFSMADDEGNIYDWHAGDYNFVTGGGSPIVATAINDKGDIIGRSGCGASPVGGFFNHQCLADLLGPYGMPFIGDVVPLQLNDNGDVFSSTYLDGTTLYKLYGPDAPVPEPSTYLLLMTVTLWFGIALTRDYQRRLVFTWKRWRDI